MQSRVVIIFRQGLEEPSREVQGANGKVFSTCVCIRTFKDRENGGYPTAKRSFFPRTSDELALAAAQSVSPEAEAR